MIKQLIPELKQLFTEIKKLDFKTTYIFMSVAIITFISISFSSPNVYYDIFGHDPVSEIDSRFISRIYWFLMDGTLMFLLPVLSIKFIFKEKLSEFGIRWGDYKFGLTTLVIFLIFMIPILWIVSGSEVFTKTYPQGGSEVRNSIGIFLLYELCILIYMLGWEFFWRGYMLFGLKSKFGYYTIFIQMIPFFILHKGKPEIELFASIFAGLVLGVQALRSRSFIYAWLLHWMVMVLIDGISILRFQFKFYKIWF